MVIVIALFTLANITFYNTLSLETLQGTNAVAIVSRRSRSNHKAFDLFSTANSRRNLAWRYSGRQVQYSTLGLCVYLVSGP